MEKEGKGGLLQALAMLGFFNPLPLELIENDLAADRVR